MFVIIGVFFSGLTFIGNEHYEPAFDICNNSEITVQRYGYIIFWPKEELYSSCKCYLEGTTWIEIKTFSPLYNTETSNCTSTGYINSYKIPCKNESEYRVGEPTISITIVTPGNDWLWARFFGKNVSVSCKNISLHQDTKRKVMMKKIKDINKTSESASSTTMDFDTNMWGISHTDLSTDEVIITDAPSSVTVEFGRNITLLLALTVGAGIVFLILCFLVVMVIIYHKRQVVQEGTNDQQDTTSYFKDTVTSDKDCSVGDYTSIQDERPISSTSTKTHRTVVSIINNENYYEKAQSNTNAKQEIYQDLIVERNQLGSEGIVLNSNYVFDISKPSNSLTPGKKGVENDRTQSRKRRYNGPDDRQYFLLEKDLMISTSQEGNICTESEDETNTQPKGTRFDTNNTRD